MDEIKKFDIERNEAIKEMAKDKEMKEISNKWMRFNTKHKYVYNHKWMGVPIIQLPNDIMAIQELIWEVKPDLIIETGIAHGGSIIHAASILELLGNTGEVLGIDIEIREHNLKRIMSHPMSKRIKMIEGSSVEEKTLNYVTKISSNKKNIMVFLDSCHTHEHVKKELDIYSNFVSKGSYLVVFDTSIQFEPNEFCDNRPWGVDNNPWTAVHEFIKENENFIIDESIHNKLVITSAIDGYLKRVK
ncbi:cephalosporin hydroxylase family protein [Heliorestis convoluta]|uniref:Cephalosporin hydroxylase n=1 Tax=Heliorestis convoluta TaxID=356322 RepID=A0A5Q2N252_9FIRM|nr:CmcI family methyltransferase [Heliorestis convoluta]QGG48897.1 cephalosporin hydroxylase [Heliorestis convoluta]